MTKRRDWLLIPLIVIFYTIFLVQDRYYTSRPSSLRFLPSSAFIKASSGYLYRVAGEIFFIQAAVFLGGMKPGVDQYSYAHTLAHNYVQIASLYPQFKDVYHYSQAYLPHVGPDVAKIANEVLEIGKKANRNDFLIPFFQGFNYFRYLEEPIKASEIFQEASQLPNAPPMFAHLAVILAAEGGQLEAAILFLKSLLKDPDIDEIAKRRYLEELGMCYDALSVQEAVTKYKNEKGAYPANLEELVPQYLNRLPIFGSAFVLTWKAPNVGLKRP
jgi:tetratricopeptide (TPR) repeat protein